MLQIKLFLILMILDVFCLPAFGQTTAEEWYNKGFDLDQIQYRYDEAIQAYDEAIRLDPRYAKPWNNKGRSLEEQGKYDEAVEAYDEAIRLDPEFNNAWINKGYSLEKLGRLNEAVLCYDEIIRRTSGYDKARVLYLKSVALYDLGERDDAIRTLNEAIEINPSYAATGISGSANNATAENISLINESDPEALIHQGQQLGIGYCELGLKYLDRAIAIYDESIRLNPNNATAWNNKGYTLITQASMDQAHYSDTYLPAWINQEAHMRYRMDKGREAYNCFDKATQLDPNLPAAWYNKAYSLWALSSDNDTFEYYQNIIECYKKYHELYNTPEGKSRMDTLWIQDDREQDVIVKYWQLITTPHDVERVAGYT